MTTFFSVADVNENISEELEREGERREKVRLGEIHDKMVQTQSA